MTKPALAPARCWGAAALAAFLFIGAPAAAFDVELPEPIAVGSAAPDFTLNDTTGKSVSLSEFKGKVILLSFWSCHTDTCFTTVKVFEDLLARLGPLGLVAPTVCEEIPTALAADNYAGLLQRCSTGQRILLDPRHQVRVRYKIHQLPSTLLIGPDLTVLEIVRGVPPLRNPEFHERIEKLVLSAAQAPAGSAVPPGPPGPELPGVPAAPATPPAQ